MTQTTTQTELIKRSFIEMMKDIGTSIPGRVIAFDSETQTAQLQIAINGLDADLVPFKHSPLIQCPVYFSGGSEFFIEHEIAPGDEGVILFSQRCMDSWKNEGGIADNPILRFHDFSDACFLPGLRSKPNAIGGFSNNGVKIRNKDGDRYIWLKNDGSAEIKVSALTIDGDVNVSGDVDCTGTVTGDVDVNGGGKSLLTHVHVGSPTAPAGPISPTGVPV